LAIELRAVFLFTDIVGSTGMWDRDTDAMDRAMNIHDEVLHSVISEFEGEVFKHSGDGICAAFQDAAAALQAAVQSQIRLGDVPWPESDGPKVRMAIHSGPFREHAGDYFGLDVCLARRILEFAQGGSVLITGPAVAQLDAASRDEAWLLDLGYRHLKDVTDPVRVFRVATFQTRPHPHWIGAA
jgi:class 3 adenylate cyclase